MFKLGKFDRSSGTCRYIEKHEVVLIKIEDLKCPSEKFELYSSSYWEFLKHFEQ